MQKLIHDFLTGLERDPRRLFRCLLVGGLLALAGWDAVQWATFRPPTASLRLEVESSVASEMQVYFDTGAGLSEAQSVTHPVSAGTGGQTIAFALPTAPVKNMRIDPLQVPGRLVFHSIRVVRDRDGSELRAFEPELLRPRADIARTSSDLEGLTVETRPDARDPQLTLLLPTPIDIVPTLPGRVAALLWFDALVYAGFFAFVYLAFRGWPPRPRSLPRPEDVLGPFVRWFPDGWAVLLFVLPVACAVCVLAASQADSYYLNVALTCDRPVVPQFYFDTGSGFREQDSTRAEVATSIELRTVRFPVQVRSMSALRFDPAAGPVKMQVNSVEIRSDAEDWLDAPSLYSFDLRTLWPVQEMLELVHEDDATIRLAVEDGATDPVTKLTLPAPLRLGVHWTYVVRRTFLLAAAWLLLWIVAVETGCRLFRPGGWVRAWAGKARGAWRRLSPGRMVWLVAGASVVLSCYPVIFCGKSFASPNFSDGTYQLYQRFPTLPGTSDTLLESGQGADIGTMAWQAAPASVVESRALFHDGELPLWNRYNNAGEPLLAKGRSMLGDPLHLIVLVMGGRAWAWDAKFVLAKWLFAAGVGLLVLAATDCLPAALLLAFSSAFIGFFAYRLNHPAYFSLCYAPWILLAWLRIVQAPTWRLAMGWAGGLLLATWAEINSGSLPEASTQVLYLNGCGVVLLLLTRRPVEFKFQRLLGLAVAAGIFLLLATPLLVAFFDLLKHSLDDADAPAQSVPLGAFIGLFDDIFFRQLRFREAVSNPSTNFLVLAGVLLAVSHFKRLVADRMFAVVLLSALLPAAVVFGVLPPAAARALPTGGEIDEPAAVYSAVLIVHLFVLAGFGWKQCLLPSSRARWWRDGLAAALAGAALVYAFSASVATPPDSSGSASGEFSVFFRCYVPVVVVAAALLPVLLRRLRFRGLTVAVALLAAACLGLIHGRQGLQLPGVFSRYTPVLPNRVDLLAPSKGIEFLRADREGPFRAVGLGNNLKGGYSGVAGVEGIEGPDAMGSPYIRDLKVAGMKLGDFGWQDTVRPNRIAAGKRFYNLLNVRYFLGLPGEGSLADVPGLRLIGRLDLDVYRNQDAWPRAFFVDRVTRYEGTEQFLREVLKDDAEPFAAVDSGELQRFPELATRLAPTRAGRTVVPASRYRLTSNTTSFEVQVPRAGVIVLSEAYVAGSVLARLDGRPARVFRVNHAFRGIVVDRPGLCRVTFLSQPPQWGLALGASALGVVLLVAAWWVLRRARPATVAPGGPLPEPAAHLPRARTRDEGHS